MKRLTTVVIALACGIGAVWADTDPIAERRALMKNDGMAAKKMFDMLKGTTLFDLATVQDPLKTLAIAAGKGADAVSGRQQDRRRHGGAAGDLAKQGRLQRPVRQIRQGCRAAKAGIVDEASFKKSPRPSSRIRRLSRALQGQEQLKSSSRGDEAGRRHPRAAGCRRSRAGVGPVGAEPRYTEAEWQALGLAGDASAGRPYSTPAGANAPQVARPG